MGLPVDFGIITIREDEFVALLDAFPNDPELHSGQREYNLRSAPTHLGELYRVAIVRCVEQGNGEAQSAARDMLEDLDPQWLIISGIAGTGPDSDHTLGDVVVSTRILDFSVEALLKTGDREYDVMGGPVEKSVGSFVANLGARKMDLGSWSSGLVRPPVVHDDDALFYGDEDWRKKVRRALEHHFGRDATAREPKFVTGAIASSDRLVKGLPWRIYGSRSGPEGCGLVEPGP